MENRKNIVRQAASFALGKTGVTRSPAEIYSLHPGMRKVFETIDTHPECRTLLEKEIRDYSLQDRIPLLDINTGITRRSQREWKLPPGYKDKIDGGSPYSSGLSAGETLLLLNRLDTVNREEFTRLIEDMIYNYFDLSRDISLSIVLYGSFVWNPRSSINDIDIIAIIEDTGCCTVEVGSHPIACPGIGPLISGKQRITMENIDVTLVGRGAIPQNIYNHDLCNIAVWETMGGLCVKGKPIANGICDFMMLQDAFIGFGFGVKGGLVENRLLAKGPGIISQGMRGLVFLGKKYDVPMPDSLEHIGEKVNQTSFAYSSPVDFFRELEELSLFAGLIARRIKEKTIDSFSSYLKDL
ncbi:MAG: hypothetical protein GY757_55025 [bacterium]|nr:hypothetical protein [bacterium]